MQIKKSVLIKELKFDSPGNTLHIIAGEILRGM